MDCTKARPQMLIGLLVAWWNIVPPAIAQSRPFTQPGLPGVSKIGVSIQYPRVVEQSADGTDVLLGINFSYDGFAGTSVILQPVVKDSHDPHVSFHFVAPPVTIGRGQGIIN